ncbi:50S ribosomal protein L6 [Arenicella xantha]|uniref:Large ribosomal subunit protein uL6 n=1 Tax=Arenicella xantha TaxID=644221 RepID=A0A395JIY5_9GAMM|nr:50S ribosomal protein L6 [Arenicella xantha]RBP49823.1 LSU ribosomal protein L6P [Arenicella xantha]
MSRIANAPVSIPSGVEVTLDGQLVKVKGSKGQLEWNVHELVTVKQEDTDIKVSANRDSKEAVALAGTTRALVNNMVTGVSAGFQKKLTIIGVGYRAQAQGQTLNLTLGFSHPVAYAIPEGIKVETPSNTEIVVSGVDKQAVGQVAAEIRAYRKPEPYKGKGVRYADEYVLRKQAKKK